jgi:hypothetical protein
LSAGYAGEGQRGRHGGVEAKRRVKTKDGVKKKVVFTVVAPKCFTITITHTIAKYAVVPLATMYSSGARTPTGVCCVMLSKFCMMLFYPRCYAMLSGAV